MIKVTIDVFSGRPNPAYLLDGDDADSILRDASRRRTAVVGDDEGFTGLGFRGVIVESFSDDTDERFGLPATFKLGSGAASDEDRSLELAERLIRLAPTQTAVVGSTEVDEELSGKLLTMLESPRGGYEPPYFPDSFEPLSDPRSEGTCRINRVAFNPGFWNDDTFTRTHNNCYNYASNWRNNTFAQPGKGSGNPIQGTITCAKATNAIISDGCHVRGDCFPDSERPRPVIALVVSPGNGPNCVNDFHFLRWLKEGYWGHKPGGTKATNLDNANAVIQDPRTAYLACYTQFCGFFYGCNSQRQRIRGVFDPS